MANYNNDATSLGGDLFINYSDKITRLVPDNVAPILSLFPFAPGAEYLGKYFAQPVSLAVENGISISSGGYTTFAPASAGSVDQAMVKAYLLYNRAIITDDIIAMTAKGRKVAAMDASALVMKNLGVGFKRAQADNCLYGGVSRGIVSTANNTTKVVVMTQKSFAAGGFWGANNKLFDIFSADGTGLRGTFRLIGTNIGTFSVTFDTTSDLSQVVSTDQIWPTGAAIANSAGTGVTVNEAIGYAAIQATQTGSLFSLTNSMYRGNYIDATTLTDNSGKPSFDLLNAVSVTLSNKGNVGDMKVLMCNEAWGLSNDDLAAKRFWNQNSTPDAATKGFNAITYLTQTGKITLIGSPWIKRGDMFFFPDDGSVRRIGAYDAQLGGAENDNNALRALPGSNSYEMWMGAITAVFTDNPGAGAYLYNVAA